mgnify:FL=1
MLLEDLRKDSEIKNMLTRAETQLEVMGYTEHSYRHINIVCNRLEKILRAVGASEKEIEIGKIAGYLHDIGNCVNRKDHSHSGAILAYFLLTKKGMSFLDAAEVMQAIGNHDEETGQVSTVISAALILADKSDVHRSRVRRLKVDKNGLLDKNDIHDRVNYAVVKSDLLVDKDNKKIKFVFEIDKTICSPMDYFEIFLDRMKMCRVASAYLGYDFQLLINSFELA